MYWFNNMMYNYYTKKLYKCEKCIDDSGLNDCMCFATIEVLRKRVKKYKDKVSA